MKKESDETEKTKQNGRIKGKIEVEIELKSTGSVRGRKRTKKQR